MKRAKPRNGTRVTVQTKVDPAKWARLKTIAQDRDVKIPHVVDEALGQWLEGR
jgi:hypothetical protein